MQAFHPAKYPLAACGRSLKNRFPTGDTGYGAADISPERGPERVTPAARRDREVRETATTRLLVAYREQGDARARDRLVQLYLPLVETLARRYRGPGAEFDDLLQAGSIGLLNAIERYDSSRSDEFAAFAVPTVAGEMKRYIRDRGGTVRLPRTLHEAAGRLPKERERLTRRLGRTPSDAELAQAVGVSPAELGELEAALRAPASDTGDTMADPRAPDSEERLLLAGAFEALDEQEREIVYLRFIEDLDRKEVAGRLGISESQLGRRTRRALAKLRSELEEDGVERATNGEAPTVPAPAPGPAREPEPEPAPQAKPAKQGGHSGRLLLRMPRTLHDDLAEAAEREGLSLNRFITGTLTAAIKGRGAEPGQRVEQPDSSEFEAREVPRWLPTAIVVNIVVVAVAAIVALVLLVIAWQNGW
jgi:RNA polymerase sigma-B factor